MKSGTKQINAAYSQNTIKSLKNIQYHMQYTYT